MSDMKVYEICNNFFNSRPIYKPLDPGLEIPDFILQRTDSYFVKSGFKQYTHAHMFFRTVISCHISKATSMNTQLTPKKNPQTQWTYLKELWRFLEVYSSLSRTPGIQQNLNKEPWKCSFLFHTLTNHIQPTHLFWNTFNSILSNKSTTGDGL